MSQTVWPLNENGEIVFTAGTGSSNVAGYLSQDVLPSKSDGSVPVKLVGVDVNVSEQIEDHNTSGTAHQDIRTSLDAQVAAAEAARDAAQLSAGVYADTAAGIAAVADGRYFSVPDGTGSASLILYKRAGAAAVEVTRYPSVGYFDFVEKPAALQLPAIADASGVELLGFDDTGAARFRVSKSVADQVTALISFAPYDPIAAGLLPKQAITCWGDSMTQGAGAVDLSITSVMASILSRTVNNRGIGGHDSTRIAIRQGSYPLTVTLSGNQIPASGGVAVTAKNSNILSAGGSFTGTVHVTIGGVPGVISTDASGNWTFTRDAAGTSVSVAAGVQAVIDDVGTAFIPAPSQNRGDTIVIWSGRNGVVGLGRTAVLECRDRIADMIKYLTPLSKRVIVVSVCNGRRLDSSTGNNYEPSGSSRYNDVIALNRELKETFGAAFVDLRYYMVNHAIYDAGLAPTATDLADIAADCIPTSLLTDNVHFNSTGYTMAGQYLARQIIARGW